MKKVSLLAIMVMFLGLGFSTNVNANSNAPGSSSIQEKVLSGNHIIDPDGGDDDDDEIPADKR